MTKKEQLAILCDTLKEINAIEWNWVGGNIAPHVRLLITIKPDIERMVDELRRKKR